MPTISFSQNYLVSGSDTGSAPSKAIGRIICGLTDQTGVGTQCMPGLFDTNLGGWIGSGGLTVRTCAILIMRGTVPTDFSGLTSTTSRSTDVLITYNTANITRQVNTNPALISSAGVNATASGTATWFWVYSAVNVSGTHQLRSQIVGNVGPIGSGADLEISDTNIVSGRSYFISKLLIRMPDTITY